MTPFLGTVGSSVAVCVVIVSGVTHLLRFSEFAVALRDQHVWPASTHLLAAMTSIAAELSLGIIGALTILAPERVDILPTFPLAAIAGLMLAYAAYASYLLRNRPGVPCGCSARSMPVTRLIPVRAVCLALLAGFGALSSSSILQRGDASSELLVTAFATLAITIVVWLLPGALKIERESDWRLALAAESH